MVMKWNIFLREDKDRFSCPLKRMAADGLTTPDDLDGLLQDCSLSSALAIEFLQSCVNPLIWTRNSSHIVSWE